MGNLKEGGLISERAYSLHNFSLADRWANNRRGLYWEGLISGSLRYIIKLAYEEENPSLVTYRLLQLMRTPLSRTSKGIENWFEKADLSKQPG